DRKSTRLNSSHSTSHRVCRRRGVRGGGGGKRGREQEMEVLIEKTTTRKVKINEEVVKDRVNEKENKIKIS
ncbi:hypothetical protein, partial [Nostoc sp.]